MSTKQLKLDCDVEKDCSVRAAKSALTWMSSQELADQLKGEADFLLLDMRSFSAYNTLHILKAHSLSFSTMLIRRLNRGTITLDSLISDQSLLETMAKASQVVFYDSSSTPLNARKELLTFGDMLLARFGDGFNLRALIGGMDTFESAHPSLCTDKPSAMSPSKITLDTTHIQRTVPEKSGTPKAAPAEILPHLYLGCAKDASQLASLNMMGITAVLNITTNCPNLFDKHFEYMSIEVEDSHSADLLSQLQQAITFIESIKKKGGRVFVHCHAGISRSATVCIAYMMQTQRMSLQEAYEHVRSRRPIISPNLHFMGQLTVFQQDLMCKWATNAPKSNVDVVTSLPTQTSSSSCHAASSKHPMLGANSRSISVPTDMSTTTSTTVTNTVPCMSTSHCSSSTGNVTRSRERLTLSLHSNERRKPVSHHPSSPCRVEAQNLNHSQSLNLSTTCT